MTGQKPDRLPFLDRLEIWHRCAHSGGHAARASIEGLALGEIYRATVGMGQQKFIVPYGLRLRGVEVVVERDGEPIYREFEPIVESFPGMWDFVAADRPGVTVTRLVTRRRYADAAPRSAARHGGDGGRAVPAAST